MNDTHITSFSCCIMNPPYMGSLHLEFLEKAIQISGTCVSVQPVRWLKDPVAYLKKTSTYNKYYNSVLRHIKDLETYYSVDASKIFDIALNCDIAIYKCDAKHTDGCKLPINIDNDILNKVLKTPQKLNDVIERNKIDGWRWYAIDIQPILAQGGKKYSYGWFCRFCIYNHLRSLVYKNGYDKNGKFWSELNSGIKKPKGTPFDSSIRFDTEKEAVNFENSLKTTFYHYLVYNLKTDQHTPYAFLPFMGDYTQAWSNERFYEYYKLTNDEIHDIENTMKDIEHDANEYFKNRQKKVADMNDTSFSVCIMNPPYGNSGDTTMHLKFADKCIDMTKTQVALFPFTFVIQPATKTTIRYKEHFNKYLIEVDEVDSTLFNDAAMTNVGIYKFVDNKGAQPVKITLINKHTYDIDDLTQPSRFTEYEKNIISLLDNKGNIYATVAGFHNHCTLTSLAKQGIKDEKHAWKIIDKNIEDNCKTLKDHKYILSLAETSFDGYSFFNNETGDIFDSKADVITHMQKRGRHTTRGFIFMMFDTRKEAENLRDALKRPLLRFTLYRTKYSRLISTKTNYKYIPDIDWSDERTKTDEGILMMCGCDKEKAHEYAQYCKDIIEKVAE